MFEHQRSMKYERERQVGCREADCTGRSPKCLSAPPAHRPAMNFLTTRSLSIGLPSLAILPTDLCACECRPRVHPSRRARHQDGGSWFAERLYSGRRCLAVPRRQSRSRRLIQLPASCRNLDRLSHCRSGNHANRSAPPRTVSMSWRATARRTAGQPKLRPSRPRRSIASVPT